MMTTMTRILMITTVIVSSMTTVVAMIMTIIIVVTCSFYGASLPYSQLSKVTT